MKITFSKLPEYYLIVIALLTAYSPPFYINPLILGIILILILQIIFQNKILGLLLGVLFFIINLYFLGALISELNEFQTFSEKARLLVIVGLPIWLVNLVFSITMIYRYSYDYFLRTIKIKS